MSYLDVIDKLRAIREAANAGPSVKEELEAYVQEHAGRGLNPYGDPWPATQKGEEPLENAEGAVTYTLVDDRKVVAIVRGHHALHHLGRANGAPRREIIPSELTAALEDQIKARVLKDLEEASK